LSADAATSVLPVTLAGDAEISVVLVTLAGDEETLVADAVILDGSTMDLTNETLSTAVAEEKTSETTASFGRETAMEKSAVEETLPE